MDTYRVIITLLKKKICYFKGAHDVVNFVKALPVCDLIKLLNQDIEIKGPSCPRSRLNLIWLVVALIMKSCELDLQSGLWWWRGDNDGSLEAVDGLSKAAYRLVRGDREGRRVKKEKF